MKSQAGEDSDEDYDDPIRLFDSDENAIYFGSHTQDHSIYSTTSNINSWECEKTKNDVFCNTIDSTLSRPSDQTEMLHSSSISECNFPKLCVKLVDCGKFPRYYKKYMQQILEKTKFNVDSDSDLEINTVGTKDSNLDDCFIVEDQQDVSSMFKTNQLKGYTVSALQTTLNLSKNIMKKRLERIKRRVDLEIQRALSQKELVSIDFKRNKGLVGMEITQKIVKTAALDATTDKTKEAKIREIKRKDISADTTYINAADKVLGDIGTQLIPIPQHIDSSFYPQIKRNIEEDDKTAGNDNKVLVQCSLDKISEKLLNTIKSKKNSDLFLEAKIQQTKHSNILLEHPENKLNIVNLNDSKSEIDTSVKSAESSNKSSHVRDVKKSNKYKNDQLKIQSKVDYNTLIQVSKSKLNKTDTKVYKCNKNIKEDIKDSTQVKNFERDEKPHKTKPFKKHKREPNSPILLCNTLPKKPKYHESNVNLNTSEEPENLNMIVNKQINAGNVNKSQNNKQTNNDLLKSATINTKSPEVNLKQDYQKETCMLQDETVKQTNDVRDMGKKLPGKDVKNCNDVHKVNFKPNNFNSHHQLPSTSHNNKIQIMQSEIKVASVASHSTLNKNVNLTVTNKNAPTAMLFTDTSQSANISNQLADSFRSQFTVQTMADKVSLGNVSNNNVNVPMHNRYTILKTNQQINFELNQQINFKVRSHYPERRQTMDSRTEKLPISVITPSRNRNSQNFNTGYYQSVHNGTYPNYLPRSVKSGVPNSFIGPQAVGQPKNNLSQNQFISVNSGVLNRFSASQDVCQPKKNPTLNQLGSLPPNFVKDTIKTNSNMLQNLNIPVRQKNCNTQIEQPKGYSPPILPIPTYQKVLDKVISDIKMQNQKLNNTPNFEVSNLISKTEIKPVSEINVVDKCCKRKLSHEFNRPDECGRKDVKKFSWEEYKVFRNDNRSNKCKNKTNYREKYKTEQRKKIDYKYVENADYSTETDLGYDSDSTVVL